MYLLQTALEGTTFKIHYLDKQSNLPPVGIDLSLTTIKSNSSLFTKYPIGTIYAISEINWGEIESTVLGNPRPLCNDYNVLSYVSSESVPTNEDINYLIDTFLSAGIKHDIVCALGIQFNATGYAIDAEAKCKAYKTDTSGTFKESIMRAYPCPTESEIGFHVEPDVWYLLIRNVLKGEATLLIGPTGSGKTELVSHIAKALSKPLNIQDMGTVQDAQSALLGVHRLNKEGHSSFEYAPFVSHIQTDGIVLLDELNR